MRVSPHFASKLTFNKPKKIYGARKNATVEYTAALRVVVSGYWYMGVCARVLISRVRQVQDKSVCVRSEEERYVHVILRFTKMTALGLF